MSLGRKLLLIFLMAILIASLNVGCGEQKEASGVGEAIAEEEIEEQPEGDLEISKVTILKFGEDEYTNYTVVFWAGNNSDLMCKASKLVCTLYDADGKVVGNEDAALGPTIPPGRWVAGDPIYDVPAAPARAEVKVRDLEWAEVKANTPRFKTIQADYVPGSFAGKVVGMFEYQGQDLETIQLKAILLDENGIPIGLFYDYVNGVTEGENPFELILGDTMSEQVSSVELSFIW